MTTPADLLAAELSRDGTRPFVTYYNDRTGERVELSVATAANWVAKTANLLVDEFGVEPGDPVVVRLPLHWQAVVVLLAGWSAGARVSFGDAGVVTFATDDVDADGDVVRMSLAPMGADFSRLVAAQPDVFVPFAPSGADLVEAAATDLPYAARVMTTSTFDTGTALSYGLLGPLAASGSIVLVADADPNALVGHAETERVTHTLGVTIPGLTRLDS
jgi:uncharacterized protein (TIGR03089 family)